MLHTSLLQMHFSCWIRRQSRHRYSHRHDQRHSFRILHRHLPNYSFREFHRHSEENRELLSLLLSKSEIFIHTMIDAKLNDESPPNLDEIICNRKIIRCCIIEKWCCHTDITDTSRTTDSMCINFAVFWQIKIDYLKKMSRKLLFHNIYQQIRTWLTPLMLRPRAHASVATSTGQSPISNRAFASDRSDWSRSLKMCVLLVYWFDDSNKCYCTRVYWQIFDAIFR